MKGFGWLNTLYDLAMDGIFTYDNKSAINSVMATNLYEVLTYLSYKTAKNDYESNVRDAMDQEHKMKVNSKRNK